MTEPSEKRDEDAFNETLKRMLRTPPEPKGGKERRPDRSGTPQSKEDRENGCDAE